MNAKLRIGDPAFITTTTTARLAILAPAAFATSSSAASAPLPLLLLGLVVLLLPRRAHDCSRVVWRTAQGYSPLLIDGVLSCPLYLLWSGCGGMWWCCEAVQCCCCVAVHAACSAAAVLLALLLYRCAACVRTRHRCPARFNALLPPPSLALCSALRSRCHWLFAWIHLCCSTLARLAAVRPCRCRRRLRPIFHDAKGQPDLTQALLRLPIMEGMQRVVVPAHSTRTEDYQSSCGVGALYGKQAAQAQASPHGPRQGSWPHCACIRPACTLTGLILPLWALPIMFTRRADRPHSQAERSTCQHTNTQSAECAHWEVWALCVVSPGYLRGHRRPMPSQSRAIR